MQRPPRATLVATPTPTPAPVVVTKEDYDAIPVGQFYYFQGRLQQKMAWATSPPSTASNVSETATPVSPIAVVNTAQSSDTGPSSLLVSTIDLFGASRRRNWNLYLPSCIANEFVTVQPGSASLVRFVFVPKPYHNEPATSIDFTSELRIVADLPNRTIFDWTLNVLDWPVD